MAIAMGKYPGISTDMEVQGSSTMKTYERKKLVNEEIEEVLDLCRLCLKKPEKEVPIFKNSEDFCAVLAMRIMICVGLEMTHEEYLPNKICMNCYQELDKYYKFRRKCEVSYQRLKAHVSVLNDKAKQLNIDNKSTLNTSLISKIDNNGVAPYLVENKSQVGPIEHKMKDFNNDKSIHNHLPFSKINKEDVAQYLVEDSEQSMKVVEPESEGKDAITKEEVQTLTSQEPDISTFLTTVLTELGILSRTDDLLTLEQGVTDLELEAGDGERLVLQLIEEDQLPSGFSVSDPLEVDIKNTFDKAAPPQLNGATKRNGKGDKKKAGWWCARCGRGAGSAAAARRHAAAHGGARPHSCRTCQRAFTQRAARDRHMLLHLDERPFKCPSCPKSFTQRGGLAAHARTHAPPHRRPLPIHACTLCDKVFLHASGLSRHMPVHGGRAFECDACARRFTDRSSLARHLRTTHTHT